MSQWCVHTDPAPMSHRAPIERPRSSSHRVALCRIMALCPRILQSAVCQPPPARPQVSLLMSGDYSALWESPQRLLGLSAEAPWEAPVVVPASGVPEVTLDSFREYLARTGELVARFEQLHRCAPPRVAHPRRCIPDMLLLRSHARACTCACTRLHARGGAVQRRRAAAR
jgi:hypothetical protein